MTKIIQYIENLYIATRNLLSSVFGSYKPRPTKDYYFNFLVALDELLNALFGGSPKETISSRSARARNDGNIIGCLLCKILSIIFTHIFGEKLDHCTSALDVFISIVEGEFNEISNYL